MFRKIFGFLIMVVTIAAGLFMIISAKYSGWVAIVDKEFVDFWYSILISLAGWLIGLIGPIVGLLLFEEGDIVQKLKKFREDDNDKDEEE